MNLSRESLRESLRAKRAEHLARHYPGDLATDMAAFLQQDLAAPSPDRSSGESYRIGDARYAPLAARKVSWLLVGGSMVGSAIAACLVTAWFLHSNVIESPTKTRAVAIAKIAPLETPIANGTTTENATAVAEDKSTDEAATSASPSGSATASNEEGSLIPSYESMAVPAWSVVPSAETLDSVKVGAAAGTTGPSSTATN